MDTTSITVLSCVKMREKDGKPIYAVALSDGRGGESFNAEIPIGTRIEDLSVEQTQYGLRIKKKNQGGNGFNGRGNFQRASESEKFPGFAMAWAKDLAVAGKIPVDGKGGMAEYAERFLGWLDRKHSKRSGAAAPAAQQQPAPGQQQQQAPAPGSFEALGGPQGPTDQNTDDLPF